VHDDEQQENGALQSHRSAMRARLRIAAGNSACSARVLFGLQWAQVASEIGVFLGKSHDVRPRVFILSRPTDIT
jgi:hypothetical protein